MSDFNFLITHPHMRLSDYRLNRRWVFASEPYQILADRATTIYDILVMCGIFKSKKDARRNWQRGELRDGMNDYAGVGKLRHHIFVHRIPAEFEHLEDEPC